jgi:group I intron endonuclease
MVNSYGIIYVGTNTVNGKQYVGQTTEDDPLRYWKRRVWSAKSGRRIQAIHSAIRKYGENAFTFEVIWCAFDKLSLGIAENLFITSLNTLAPNGYNLKGGGPQGKWSEEAKQNTRNRLADPLVKKARSEMMRIVQARPEVNQKRSASLRVTFSQPDIKAGALKHLNSEASIKRRGNSIKNAHADPIVRERYRIAITAAHARPEVKERFINSLRAASGRPEVIENRRIALVRSKEKRSQSMIGRLWINDGNGNNRRLKPSVPLPEGWVYGRTTRPDK